MRLLNNLKQTKNRHLLERHFASIDIWKMLEKLKFNTIMTCHDQHTSLLRFKRDISVIDRVLYKYFKTYSMLQPMHRIEWNKYESNTSHSTMIKLIQNLCESYLHFINAKIDSEMGNLNSQNSEGIQGLRHHRTLFHLIENFQITLEQNEIAQSDLTKILWISAHGPETMSLDLQMWLGTDPYSQALLDLQHVHNPTNTEIEANVNTKFESNPLISKDWRQKMSKFYDRSDSPMLYSYIDQSHSSDFYDLNRSIYLQHMVYYLLITGKTPQFFPEKIPPAWSSNIEKHKYRFINALTALIKNRVLRSSRWPIALHCGHLENILETALKFTLNPMSGAERLFWNIVLSTLMANHILLSHPAIACQSVDQLERALHSDNSQGKLYTLGPAIQALFYLPKNAPRPFEDEGCGLESPTKAIMPLVQQLAKNESIILKLLSVGLETIVNIIDQRGEKWFKADGETMSEALLRGLPRSFEANHVFSEYIQVSKDLWSKSAREIAFDEAFEKMKSIESEVEEFETFMISQYEAEMSQVSH